MQKSICNFLLHCDFVFLRLFELSESHSNQVQDPKAESTTSTIQLTWVKPEGGVTGYRVVLTPKGGERSEVKVEDGEATSQELTGLVPGREHEIEIYAINGEAESEKVTFRKHTSKWLNTCKAWVKALNNHDIS